MLTVLLLMILVSCKKKEFELDAFDITKFSIVGKLSSGIPYIISLDSEKAVLTHYSAAAGKYSFIDGLLSLNFTDEVICSFVIENGSIKSYKGPVIINTYELVKIPATNQLDGKTFKGSWNNSAYLSELKFSGTQYTETTNNQQSIINYTLINNLAVKKAEGANPRVFILMNNKLEGVGHNSPNTFWGTFSNE